MKLVFCPVQPTGLYVGTQAIQDKTCSASFLEEFFSETAHKTCNGVGINMQPVHQVHKKATSGGGGPRHRLLSSVLYTITSIRERYGTQGVVDTKSSRYRRVETDRACRTAPPGDSPPL